MLKKSVVKQTKASTFLIAGIIFLSFVPGRSNSLYAESAKKNIEKEFVKSYNKSTLELFYFINTAPFDFSLCPYAIQGTLLMSYMGAKEATSKAFEKALSLTINKGQVPKLFEQEFSDLSSRIKGKKAYSFTSANAMWLSNSINILSSYKKIVKNDFNADVFNIDFTHPSLATYKINTWISNQTNKTIPNFLATNNIPTATSMMLTSACTFKGEWKYPFPTQLTAKKTFHSQADGSDQKLVNMMQLTEKLPFYEDKDFSIITLPIKKHIDQSNLSLVLVLPKSSDYTNPYGTFYSAMQDSGNTLSTYLKKLKDKKVTLVLPKFRIATSFSIKESLSLMGLQNAFETSANFSGISGKNNLSLDDVLTSSTFQINEFGVAATASSSSSFKIKSEKEVKSTKSILFDRPFLYFLIDTDSHFLLFLGEVSHPK